jgi:DNA-binding CsgD family transcriptional regulator
VHDVLVDVVCTGRFYDFLEKRDGRWGFVLRQPIYEKDRMDPVDPSQTVKLDPALLNAFPAGYRHLAYLQSQIGYPVKKDMPGLTGPEVEKLYAALTPREREVFEAVIEGKTNKQIAESDGSAAATIKLHRSRVLSKMQVESAAELIALTSGIDMSALRLRILDVKHPLAPERHH